jgi:hypothetical protein
VALDTISTYSSATKQVCNQSFTNVQQFFTPPGSGSIYDGLQLGLKRTGPSLNAGLAYTWGRTKNSTEGPFYYPNKPFASGIKDEWANGTDDQRHSLTANSEYRWKYGLSLSSLYRFGSGLAYATSTGTAAPNGGTPGFNRTVTAAAPVFLNPGAACPTGSTCFYAPQSHFYFDPGYGYLIMNRNSFRGVAYHRVDARLQEVVPIHERYKVTLGVEAFNLFNHTNPYTYTTVANSTNYGKPATAGGSGVLEYAARQLQFLVRFSF